MTAEEIIKVVTDSKLRGRGGAGFPAGIKWGGTRSNPAPRYLVVNADESEPGSFANRIAMDSDPHMLLEGMIICSFAIDAHAAYIYIRGENLHGFEVLEGAVREAREAGFLGKGIFGTNYELEIYVHRGAGAYVCGEETALMESLEGKRGQPRTRPPHPFQVGGGVFGRPTVVNNVETLMCAPHIINRGPEWFAAIGSPNCPGPKVYCVSGNVNRPGVYEAPMGLPLRELIYGEQFGQGVPGRAGGEGRLPRGPGLADDQRGDAGRQAGHGRRARPRPTGRSWGRAGSWSTTTATAWWSCSSARRSSSPTSPAASASPAGKGRTGWRTSCSASPPGRGGRRTSSCCWRWRPT